MPFGFNSTPFRGEQHPVHGETANRNWTFVKLHRDGPVIELHLRMRTRIRAGQVDKLIRLVEGQNVVYCRHVIDMPSGPMCFAHHAMLRFPDEPKSGLISTSRYVFGQVFPEPVELPENRGYSILKPGAEFSSLACVPTITGEFTDLSSYPDRRGFEDVAQVLNDPDSEFAWSAVSFPTQRYVWFALKNPRVLSGTVFWFSNGGRHYPPWNGRHVGVLGIEEATSYFIYGLKASVHSNPFSKKGFQTALNCASGHPLSVNLISGIAIIPRGFDRVQTIEPHGTGIRLISCSGKYVDVPVDMQFVAETKTLRKQKSLVQAIPLRVGSNIG